MLGVISIYLNEVVRSEDLWSAAVHIEAMTAAYGTGAMSAVLAEVEEADTHAECVEAAKAALEAIAEHAETLGLPDEYDDMEWE